MWTWPLRISCRRAASAALLLLVARRVAADNLSCNGTGMDWYIDMVGETPCLTYQKLRQICNAQFQVGVMNVNTPPDACTDQLSECCCNNVAFALSMFCLNCQQNIGNGTGFDAGVGAYQDYLGTCPSEKGLPSDIQTAVCNKAIKVDDDLYTNGWDNGAWFYIFSRDAIVKDNIVANNNSFTHCASTTININNASSSSSSSTPIATSSSLFSFTALPAAAATASAMNADPATSRSGLSGGAAAGIAIGAVIAIGAAGAAWWFCYYRPKRRQRAGLLEGPLENGGARARAGGMLQVDPSLLPTSYPYSDIPPSTLGASDYSDGHVRSNAGGRSSAPYDSSGGGGATTASEYDSWSSGPMAPRRGLHNVGQPSISSSSASFPNPYGSSVSGEQRKEAGPLPRKRPELDSEPMRDTSSSERHLDGGPVPDMLTRSASGRLPPAYGEQL